MHFAQSPDAALPIWCVTPDALDALIERRCPHAAAFAAAMGFRAEPGRLCVVPGRDGGLGGALFGLETAPRRRDPFAAGVLAAMLPAGTWRFEDAPPDPTLAALGFLLSSYRFTRYRQGDAAAARLCAPAGVDAPRLERIAEAVAMGRDLINTPANDLGPDALEGAITAFANRHGAQVAITRGADLKTTNLPLIFAVGQASPQAPRLVDFTWGARDAPKVTLVGKGVTFDTGGLDIKPDAAMLLMKKDMGGAATALALASMIIEAGLAVRLRVLIPVVENAIAGDAFRPGDIYRSRKGLTVEIGNTDAEGRLILADALALADEEAPALLLDFATLTGAARVALGPDLPPFYCTDDTVAAAIAAHGVSAHDPVWRMPLWEPYDALLKGKISDLNNISSGPFAGSITAALFLRRFVEHAAAWAHFDVYAWSPSAKPGRPEGGEIQAARLLYDYIEARFGA